MAIVFHPQYNFLTLIYRLHANAGLSAECYTSPKPEVKVCISTLTTIH